MNARRWTAALLLLLQLLSLLALPLSAEALPDLEMANAVYVYNTENEQILTEKNADTVLYPASTVKIMVGLLACEALGNRLNETVTLTSAMLNGVSGRSLQLQVGETVTVQDLLYAAICWSYNDAAQALAVLVSGSVDHFLTAMNARARELGADQTVYANVSGLHDPTMVTTASDTAKICLAAMQNELYVEISSTVRYRMPATNRSPERIKYNRNALIATSESTAYYNPNAKGLNAGMTDEGGYCVATFAEYNGFTYLCVVMGAKEDENGTVYSYELANRLLRWCRNTFAIRELIPEDKTVCTIPATLARPNDDEDEGGVTHLRVVTAASAKAYLSADLNEETGLSYYYVLEQDELIAPAAAGTVVGRYYCALDGRVLASVDLILDESAERDTFLYGLRQIETFCKSRGFRAFAISFALLLLFDRLVLPRFRRQRAARRRHYSR